MQVSRRFCRSSSALTRAARPLVSQAYVLPTRTRSYASTTPAAKKDADDDFIVPSEWDLEFLKKFDVPAPTAEQMARAEPSPLELPGRVGELASELFEVSSVYGTIEAVGSDLQNIREFASKNPQFVEFVEEKSNAKKEVRAMFEELSKNMSPVFRKFLARMVENGDFHRLLGLAENYDELIRAYKREVNVSLYVAKLPSPEKLEVLKARVAFNHLPRGSNPIWEIKERPELLEGYSLSTKDFTIDNSLAKKKKDVQERLAAILAKVEQSTPKIAGLTGVAEPFVLQKETDIQDLATALVERAAEAKELEEAHYRAHFVDWA